MVPEIALGYLLRLAAIMATGTVILAAGLSYGLSADVVVAVTFIAVAVLVFGTLPPPGWGGR